MQTSDVWSTPEASLAAMSVFRLAEEEPLIRPSDREATGAAAARLGEWTGSVPRPVVEELMSGLSDDEVNRLVSLADDLAPERWRMLVAVVGPAEAREPSGRWARPAGSFAELISRSGRRHGLGV